MAAEGQVCTTLEGPLLPSSMGSWEPGDLLASPTSLTSSPVGRSLKGNHVKLRAVLDSCSTTRVASTELPGKQTSEEQ